MKGVKADLINCFLNQANGKGTSWVAGGQAPVGLLGPLKVEPDFGAIAKIPASIWEEPRNQRELVERGGRTMKAPAKAVRSKLHLCLNPCGDDRPSVFWSQPWLKTKRLAQQSRFEAKRREQ